MLQLVENMLLVNVLLRAVIPNVEISPLICINLSGHVIINAVEKGKKGCDNQM